MKVTRMLGLAAIVVGLGLSACCATKTASRGGSAGGAPTGFVFNSVSVNGQTIDYAVYVPRGYDAHKPMPAILFLHGSGESGTDGVKMIGQGLPKEITWNAGKWPFIVVIPQKPVEEKQWEAYDAPVMAALEKVAQRYNVDRTRVYLTGLSQGGHGCWTYGAAHPGVFAAIAPVCGYGDPAEVASKLTGVPIWAFHGDADDVVNPDQTRKMVAAILAAHGDAKMTIYPGVNHGSWEKAYADPVLPEWLLAHHLEK